MQVGQVRRGKLIDRVDDISQVGMGDGGDKQENRQ